jgi:hypothetical protein
VAFKRGEPKPPEKLAPPRSGPKALAVTAVLILAFLGVLWYASFTVLHSRGPDRVFFAQDSWENGTLSLYVQDIDVNGKVPFGALTAKLVSQAGEALYEGPLGRTVQHGNWSVTVTVGDRDGSGTISGNDDLNITVAPASADYYLDLTTFYLYASGQEWAHFQIPLI